MRSLSRLKFSAFYANFGLKLAHMVSVGMIIAKANRGHCCDAGQGKYFLFVRVPVINSPNDGPLLKPVGIEEDPDGLVQAKVVDGRKEWKPLDGVLFGNEFL